MCRTLLALALFVPLAGAAAPPSGSSRVEKRLQKRIVSFRGAFQGSTDAGAR